MTPSNIPKAELDSVKISSAGFLAAHRIAMIAVPEQ